MTTGYSDSIHHALAYCAKHHPSRVSRYDGHSPLLTTASVALILSRHGADDATVVAGILKLLIDATPQSAIPTLHQNIARRFGGLIAAAAEAAAEPRYDDLGRERSWKATRFEVLGTLANASPRVAEIWMATEVHACGVCLTDIRRLGVEYAQTPCPPADLLWWHSALLEVLATRGSEVRTSLRDELRMLSSQVRGCLAD